MTTLEDILFHVKRLTLALENFNEQLKNENIAYTAKPPIEKTRRINKYDLRLQDHLKLMADIMRKMPDTDVKRKLLNPSPSEIEKLKYEWRLQDKKEREEEKEALREKQRQDLKVTSYIRPIKSKDIS